MPLSTIFQLYCGRQDVEGRLWCVGILLSFKRKGMNVCNEYMYLNFPKNGKYEIFE
jgi:hypothetical protein